MYKTNKNYINHCIYKNHTQKMARASSAYKRTNRSFIKQLFADAQDISSLRSLRTSHRSSVDPYVICLSCFLYKKKLPDGKQPLPDNLRALATIKRLLRFRTLWADCVLPYTIRDLPCETHTNAGGVFLVEHNSSRFDDGLQCVVLLVFFRHNISSNTTNIIILLL